MLSGRLSILLMLSVYSCIAIRGAHSLVTRKWTCLVPTRQRIPSPALFTTRLKSTTIDDTELPLLSLPQICKTVVDLQLPEGRCFAVTVKDLDESNPDSLFPHQIAKPDHWIRSVLHPEEVAYGLEKGKPSSSTSLVPNPSFWVGRLAMRAALGFPEYPVLKDVHGRPKLVSGMCGSISHKPGIGVALIAPPSSSTTTTTGVGIDLEVTCREGKKSIARKILTEAEKESLGRIPGLSEEEEILLRFSLKEAIYKAVHPIICQYVSFREAEVTPHADGTATCNWLLKNGAQDQIDVLTAHWRKVEDGKFFLTSASATKKLGHGDE